MNNMKHKILMTLALLITAATGAMAITDPNSVYWDNQTWSGWAENVTTHTVGDITITCSGNAKAYESTSSGEPLALQAGANDAITFTSNGKPFASVAIITDDELNVAGWTYNSSTWSYEWSGEPTTSVTLSGCNIKADVITFTFGTAEAPITVEPGEAANTWTFAMPASDVVLTPIYSAATISHAAGTPDASETPFETLKEAFAAVQDGDVITLDWNVTLTETLKTPSTASDISFTLDFNGFVIDNTGGTNYIMIDNGCELTLTDNTATQMGGLKCQYPIAGSNGGKVIFQGGRYSCNGSTAEQIASGWDEMASNSGWVMGDGKEFVNIENAPVDGFMIRVDWKAIELTIGAGKFATFYMDQNITLADGTDANIGLYTINGEGINLDNNTVTVTKVNDPIAIAGMPLLVYNGTTEQKTVTLKVTPVAPTASQMSWSPNFQGTAVDKTFDATDMAANDYYVLSGGKAFAPVKGTGTIGKNKCWLEFDHETNGSAPARQLTIVFDNGDATGVNEVIEVNEVSDDSWYDLNGRKLNAKPTRKGVYIKNGKKVVK